MPVVKRGTRQMVRVGLRLGLMAVLAVGAVSCAEPVLEATEEPFERTVFGNVFDTRAVRGKVQPLRLRSEMEGTFFEWMCLDCHGEPGGPGRHRESEANPELAEHRSIKDTFDHGPSVGCLNCHHPTNRIFYVEVDGSEMPAESADRLCAKCHGLVRRDWELGLHGRQNGYWDRTKGDRTRLSCIQCHDPHIPKPSPMRPDPPPIRSRLASREEGAGS